MENNEKKVKQVIIVRKDLKMPTGKVAAQASHASLGALLKMFKKKTYPDDRTKYEVEFNDGSILDKWLNGIFTKICLTVNSEEELDNIYNDIVKYNETIKGEQIPIVMIEDCGLTCFNGIKTKTCIGIGPFWSDDIDKFTKHLKLLY